MQLMPKGQALLALEAWLKGRRLEGVCVCVCVCVLENFTLEASMKA